MPVRQLFVENEFQQRCRGLRNSQYIFRSLSTLSYFDVLLRVYSSKSSSYTLYEQSLVGVPLTVRRILCNLCNGAPIQVISPSRIALNQNVFILLQLSN